MLTNVWLYKRLLILKIIIRWDATSFIVNNMYNKYDTLLTVPRVCAMCWVQRYVDKTVCDDPVLSIAKSSRLIIIITTRLELWLFD